MSRCQILYNGDESLRWPVEFPTKLLIINPNNSTIQNLPKTDQVHILFALDAMIRDAKSRFAYAAG